MVIINNMKWLVLFLYFTLCASVQMHSAKRILTKNGPAILGGAGLAAWLGSVLAYPGVVMPVTSRDALTPEQKAAE